MKALLTLLASCLWSSLVAQSICLSPAEFASRRKELNKEYVQAEDLFPGYRERRYFQFGGFYAMEPDERKMILAGQRFSAAFYERFGHSPAFKTTQLTIHLYLYLRPDGTVEHAAYELMQPQLMAKLTAEQTAELQQGLCAWLTSSPYPFTASRAYQTSAYLTLGERSSGPKTTARKGTLTSLEVARQTTQPDTVKRILLGMQELTSVPEIIYRFTNLEELDLSGNELTDIPAAVWALPHLKRLGLMGNRLKPEGLAQIPQNDHLDFLNLQYNQLKSVPTTLANNRRLTSLWLGHNDLSAGLDTKPLQRLRQLQDLNLYNTRLTALPRSMGRLKKLQILDLYYNQLQTLPRQMARLRRLQQLAVAHNRLKALPDRLGKMRRLEKIYVHHNDLTGLPRSLSRLKNLQVLDLNHNGFGNVPSEVFRLPSLEELDLSDNYLSDVSAGFAQLPSLKKLFLRGNPVSTDKRVSAQLPIIQQLESHQTEVFY